LFQLVVLFLHCLYNIFVVLFAMITILCIKIENNLLIKCSFIKIIDYNSIILFNNKIVLPY
jgi:hypothetical protein